MKKIRNRIVLGVLTALLLAAGVVTVLASECGDEKKLKSLMEKNDLYVQEGVFREFDTVKLASEGKLLSCFGNNAGSAYLVFDMPASPEQNTSLGSKEMGWPDEKATKYDDLKVENYPSNP